MLKNSSILSERMTIYEKVVLIITPIMLRFNWQMLS